MLDSWKGKITFIWAGQTVSFTTSCMLQLVIIWYLTELTKSAMVLSIATMAGFLPQAVLGAAIGVFVDRHNRKRVMIISDLFVALVALALAVVCALLTPPLWFFMLCLCLRSIGAAFHGPALNAITPLIVPQEHLAKLSGYTQSVMSASYIISPALGAASYAFFGLTFVAFLDIAGAIAASVTTGIVKIPPLVRAAEKHSENVLKGIKEGITALRREKGLFAMLFIGMLFSMAIMPINALFPLICMDYFGGGFKEASAAETSFAVGMLLGGLALGKTGGFKRRIFMLAGPILISGVICLGEGLLPKNAFLFFLALNIPWGFVAPFHIAAETVLFQERIAPEYLGRVFSLSGSLGAVAMPLGLMLSGAFAGVIGVNRWFALTGFFLIGVGVLTLAIPSVRKL